MVDSRYKINRKYGTKLRIIGGLAKKGYTEHDIDIISDKQRIARMKAWEIIDYLYEKFDVRIDLYNPISKGELKQLREGFEDPLVGWKQIENGYKPDYVIMTRSPDLLMGWGHMSKKELMSFDKRILGFQKREAMRQAIERKLLRYEETMPKEVSKIPLKV